MLLLSMHLHTRLKMNLVGSKYSTMFHWEEGRRDYYILLIN